MTPRSSTALRWAGAALLAVALASGLWVGRREPAFQGRTLSHWVAALQDPSAAVRDQAATALRSIGAPATPRLIRQLQERDSLYERQYGRFAFRLPAFARELLYRHFDPYTSRRLRTQAARALGVIGSPDATPAIPALVAALHDPATAVREQATEALLAMGSAALWPVIGVLRQNDPETRRYALTVIARLGAEAAPAAPTLFQLVDNAPALAGAQAAHALARLGAIALPGLTDRLQHPNPEVRRLAVEALGSMRFTARPALDRLLAAADDPDPAVRQRVLAALGQVQPRRKAVAARLLAGLQDPHPDVRLAALQTLGLAFTLGETAVGPLIATLRDPARTNRFWAARLLGDIGPAAGAALPALQVLAADDSPALQRVAEAARQRIANPAASPAPPAAARP